MNLYEFRNLSNIYDGAFSQKWLTAASEIFCQALNTPLMNEKNFQFLNKSYFNSYY